MTSSIQTVTSDTFDALVLRGTGPIAVEFMSYGCSHCREIEPFLRLRTVDLGGVMQARATLLFNDECAVCRSIAHWVRASASRTTPAALVVQPIGDDPDALRAVNANLDIWDAYAVIHLVMPDRSMKVGGEAVAEVLRRLTNCRWFAWLFKVGFARVRPFQWILDFGYTVLAKARPILGCESCGTPAPWMRFVRAVVAKVRGTAVAAHAPHFTAKSLSRTSPL